MRRNALVKSVISNILVIVVAGVVAFAILKKEEPLPTVAETVKAERAPLADAVFYDDKGNPVKPSDFRGQVLLINLWATWCPPCVVELPALDILQAKLRDKNFRVIAVSMDRDDIGIVTSFLRERGIENLDTYQDRDNDIRKKWVYDGIPASFLIDREGNIIETFEGPRKWDDGPVFERIRQAVE